MRKDVGVMGRRPVLWGGRQEGTAREGRAERAGHCMRLPSCPGPGPGGGASLPTAPATPPSCLLVLWLRNVQDRNNQLSPSSSGGHLGPVWPPSPENTPPYPGEFYLKQRLFPLS